MSPFPCALELESRFHIIRDEVVLAAAIAAQLSAAVQGLTRTEISLLDPEGGGGVIRIR